MKNHLEISFIEFLNALIKKWWLLIGFAIGGMVLSYLLAVFFVVPIYEAHTTLFIGDVPDEEIDMRMSMQDFEVSQQLINDYKEILKTRLVAEKVINELNLDIPIDVLRNNMLIASIGTTRLFIVGYTDPDPVVAAEVANAFSNQLAAAISGIVGFENIQIIDEALVPEYPTSPSVIMFMLIGGFLGGLVGTGVIVHSLFTSKKLLQDGKEIEHLLGVPILAEIPKTKMEVWHK
ncbi:YveK family protein [Petrocella sp. FN5]|uniref:YveK family protein n=1 Tax=Petrocella sp. FN5 TaxID=3032002 RepID=UPI0023DCBA28|nr:Wzz/FepE/Etk N-terminal domain-containing protein [Petrocella sp. FN5]MDF1617757.1 Wzz/FepE/Etk N-terminal domain-containing protein [Petrocella sp. FN5]